MTVVPRVVVVDDNEESLALMTYLLRCSGYEVTTARNGLEGLDAARRDVPEFLIIDIQMPVMDGFALLQELKRDPVLGSIPAFGVTALATAGDRERVLGAGFSGYLSKPIEPATFISDIEALIPPVGHDPRP